MMTGFPLSKQSERASGSCNVFYDLVSETTLHHFYNILLVSQVSLGVDYFRTQVLGGKDH